jgi:transcription-repair coupling factor (superfamily II helicase)
MPNVRVELMASIVKRTAAEKRAVMQDIADGKVQVILGTTSILKLEFHNVGLLVIDEEQKYGVAQKEKIVTNATMIDVLSLSATPIPRTMYMCIVGIRKLSSLRTPPSGRKPIISKTMERNDNEVVDAIERELARGGQVYVVVPRVAMLEEEEERLTELIPHLRIITVHGKSKNLQEAVVDFTLGKYDVLLATSLIENGIDIANANTMVVQMIQFFGLSTLHQMRGRVGRSSVQAYAYFMYEGDISEEARDRMVIIGTETELGSGHNIARADMEMRGQGDLLGKEQKGKDNVMIMSADHYNRMIQKLYLGIRQRQAAGIVLDKDTIPEDLLEEIMESDGGIGVMGITDSLKVQRIRGPAPDQQAGRRLDEYDEYRQPENRLRRQY